MSPPRWTTLVLGALALAWSLSPGQGAPWGVGVLVAVALGMAALVRAGRGSRSSVGAWMVAPAARVAVAPVAARQWDRDGAGRPRPRAPGGRAARAAHLPR